MSVVPRGEPAVLWTCPRTLPTPLRRGSISRQFRPRQRPCDARGVASAVAWCPAPAHGCAACGRHLGATAGEGDLPRGPQVGDDLLHQGIVRLATPLGQHRLDALAEHPDQLLLPVVVAIPQVDESTLGPEGTGDATLHGASLVAAEVVLLDEVLLVRHLCFFLLIWNVQVVDPFQGVQRLTAITTVQGESGGSPLHHLSDTPTDD